MNLFHILSFFSVVRPLTAYLVAPDGTAAPGASTDCSEWVQDSYDLTCAIVEEFYGITEAEYEEWNPSLADLGDGCNMISDLYYCVQTNFVSHSFLSTQPTAAGTHVAPTSSEALTTTTSESTSLASTPSTTLVTVSSTTASAISTPTPYQTGIATDCDSFHLVVSGDTCSDISTDAGITLDEFYEWNPAVGDTCGSLWLGYYVCIGTTDVTPSTVATPTPTTLPSTTTTTGTGVTTPTPYQPDMVDDCDLFHLVVSGDGCYDIAAAANITLDEFYDWNPDVGDTCATLYLGYYVCIGVE